MTRELPGVGARHLPEGVVLAPGTRILIRGETRGDDRDLIALGDMITRPHRAL
jgi:hypothetical protein